MRGVSTGMQRMISCRPSVDTQSENRTRLSVILYGNVHNADCRRDTPYPNRDKRDIHHDSRHIFQIHEAASCINSLGDAALTARRKVQTTNRSRLALVRRSTCTASAARRAARATHGIAVQLGKASTGRHARFVEPRSTKRAQVSARSRCTLESRCTGAFNAAGATFFHGDNTR